MAEQNPLIRRGYRVNHSWIDLLKSLFSLHNESVNVYSHLVGFLIAIFLACYFLVYFQPTALFLDQSFVSRWTSQFDQGKIEHSSCLSFGKEQECPEAKLILDDLFETEKLFEWHTSKESQQKPILLHQNLNYHARAYEQLDHYLRNVLLMLSNPKQNLKDCHKCLDEMILELPGYITTKVESFRQQLKVCESEPFMLYENHTFDQEWCHVISGNHTQKLVD